MSVLILFLEAAAVFLIIRRIKESLSGPVNDLSFTVEQKNQLLRGIDERLKYTQESNILLGNSLDLETALYEVTKELSASIEEADILKAFQDKITKIFNGCQCSFSDSWPKDTDKDFSAFKVDFGGERTGYFLIRGKDKIDKIKIGVLLNQLELALKRYELYNKIQELSISDSLTGMYVRRHFLERFRQELLRSAHNRYPVSLLLLDADNFKSYNDTYGHMVGDAVLREISRIVTSSLRQIDMAGRYGGEEFCLLLPETDKEGARLVAERLRQQVEEAQFMAFNERLKMTVSIGVASYPEGGQDVTSLIDNADKALYKAKALGKNRVI